MLVKKILALFSVTCFSCVEQLIPPTCDQAPCLPNCQTEACLVPSCGDGVVSSGEVCDDGNADNTDSCVIDPGSGVLCQPASCGDGFVQAGVEACDDGNTASGDGCDASCLAESCGDGVLQMALGEECDGGPSCLSDCTLDLAASCAGAPLLSGAGTIGDSAGFSGSCAGASGREQLFRFTPGNPGQSGVVTIHLHAEADLGLYLREGCQDATREVGCINAPTGEETLSLQVPGGREYTLFVDGVTPADEGNFTLEMTFTPDVCNANQVATPYGCDEVVPAFQFTLGGQSAWFHDDSFPYGFFHTYDALQAAGPNDAPRRVRVFLPREYETGQEHYPVVYMNDGQTAFFPEGFAGKYWHVAETLSALDALGKIEKVIVVAVYPLQRDREYTHAFWADGRECCLLPTYAQYVAEDVKGFIDANYRTLPQREETMIVGSSHAGLAAFHMAALHPEVFGIAAALSSSFWAGVDLNRVLNPAATLSGSALLASVSPNLSNTSLRPKLWIDWGLKRDGGTHNSFTEALATYRGEEMVSLLQQQFGYTLDADLFTFVDELGGHDEDAWAYRFGLIIERFFPRP